MTERGANPRKPQNVILAYSFQEDQVAATERNGAPTPFAKLKDLVSRVHKECSIFNKVKLKKKYSDEALGGKAEPESNEHAKQLISILEGLNPARYNPILFIDALL